MPTFYPDRFKEIREMTARQATPEAREARRQQLQQFKLQQIAAQGEQELQRQREQELGAMERLKQELGLRRELSQLEWGPQSLRARELEYRYGPQGVETQRLGIEKSWRDKQAELEERRLRELYGEYGVGGIERERLEAEKDYRDFLKERYGREVGAREEQARIQRARAVIEAGKAATQDIESMKQQNPKFAEQWKKLTPEQQREYWRRIRSSYVDELGLAGEPGEAYYGLEPRSSVPSWRDYYRR